MTPPPLSCYARPPARSTEWGKGLQRQVSDQRLVSSPQPVRAAFTRVPERGGDGKSHPGAAARARPLAEPVRLVPRAGPRPGTAPLSHPDSPGPGRAAQPGSALPARSAGQTPAPAVGRAGKRRRQRREGLSRPLRLTDSAGGQSWPRRGGINPALAGGSSCLQARLGKEPPRSFVPEVLHAQVLRKAGVPQCFQEGHEGGKQV
ncbi:unnamed protein product [Eretmochelys imbricata]